MNAYAFVATSIDELKQQLEQFDQFTPTLAFVFNSIAHNIDDIQKVFNEHNIPIFGATTAGEIVNDSIYEQSIAVMLTDMPKDYYEIFFEEVNENRNLLDLGKLLSIRALELFQNPNIILSVSGAGLVDGDPLIFGLIEALGEKRIIFGGIAGDDLKFTGTWVYTNDKKSNHGLVALIIDGDSVEMTGLATSGWEPIGDTKIVTKAEENIVYEIDHMPAIDAYIKYYGLPEDIEEAANVLGTIGARFPLLVYRWGRSPVIRTPVFGDKETKSLTFAGKVPQNSQVKFTVPPTFEIMENTIKKFQKVKDRFPEADFMLMFSCKGRHAVFGMLLEDEIRGIRAYWDKPLAGFFTYGEFGNAEDEIPDYHNSTCTVVLFKEKK